MHKKEKFLEGHCKFLEEAFKICIVVKKTTLLMAFKLFDDQVDHAFCKLKEGRDDWLEYQSYGCKQLWMEVRMRAQRVTKGTRQPSWMQSLIASYKEASKRHLPKATPKKKGPAGWLVPTSVGSSSWSTPVKKRRIEELM